MTSLQFSGSPWFLLLLAPGLLILWRQRRMGALAGRRGFLLMALQAAALAILVLSLTGPEWVSRTEVFHNPSVAVLTDRSGSFRGGETLKLGEAYAAVARAVAERYRPRRFDILSADFHERAWPVAGFPGSREPPEGGGEAPLTSLASVADFLDSSGARNLQAVFLFSDGRANLDSTLASRTWPVPVYPVVLPIRSIHEAQIESAAWSTDGPEGIEVEWVPVGPPAGNPAFKLVQGPGGRLVHAGELPAGGDGQGPRRARIPWKPAPGQGAEGLRAVLEAAGGDANFDPWNDSVAVGSGSGNRGGKRVLLLRPLRSLDEKGMVDLLHGLGSLQVGTAAPEELAALALTARDQVWLDAEALAARPELQRALKVTPARVVVYARPGSLPSEVAGVKVNRLAFSTTSEVRPDRAAADVFPAGAIRLKSVSSRGLEAPAAEAPWREAATLLEGGRRGLLLGWFPLAPGKEGLFLALPSIWGLLFDPQADFAARENLEGLFAAAAALTERQEGAVKAQVPERVHAGLPFDLGYAVPAPRGGEGRGPLEVRAIPLPGGGAGEAWPLSGPGPEIFRLEDRMLPAGAWALELARGGTVLRRDSLVSAPKAALELARLGYDRAALEELAAHSGGRVLAADSAGGVTSLLPDLPGAQVKAERTRSTRLHNTRWLFLLCVGLLAAAWLLRKRWDLD